jgi:hypothetical protein
LTGVRLKPVKHPIVITVGRDLFFSLAWRVGTPRYWRSTFVVHIVPVFPPRSSRKK